MREDWEPATLGDLVSVEHGWPFKSEEFSEQLTGRPIVVAVGNFRYEGGFRFDSTATKEYRGDYPKSFELAPGDLLLIMTCQTQGGEILGIPARIPDDGRTYLHNQRLGKVVIRDPNMIDAGFLYHLCRSRDFNSALCATASGSKILHTAPKRIEAYEFRRPPIDTQRAIADTLSSLDDKIEQNRRTGAKLEGLARAVFKAWFVDFEPVKAKAAGATAFPGMPPETFAALPTRFTNSDLGHVPQGWEVRTIRDLCSRVENGGTPRRQVDAYWSPPEVPWLTSGEVRQSFVMKTENFISKAGLDNSSAKLWPRFTTVVALYGATAGIATMLGTEVCANQACCGLLPKMAKCFVHQVLSNSLVELQQRARGSAQQNLSQSIVADFECVTASDTIVRAFEDFALPLYETCMHLATESRRLATLRDYLLPRLLSGRVRVREYVPATERIGQ